MSEESHSTSQLIRCLERLAQQEDRAALAALRSSLRDGKAIDALRVVLPFLGRGVGVRREDDAALVAGLFALHPVSGTSSLARALRTIQHETGSESVEGRFRALLDADRSELPIHLRHAVSLVGARGIGLDWEDLYRAIRFWDHDKDFVRRHWARDFWAGEAPTDAESNEVAENLSPEVPQS